MAWSETDDRLARKNLNMETTKNTKAVECTDKEVTKDCLLATNNALDRVLLPIRSSSIRGNPPALIKVPAAHTFLNPKTESLSDGELSDFSLNDTEEDEEEFRNCVLLNGSHNEGKFLGFK